jgi:hypothetical protein
MTAIDLKGQLIVRRANLSAELKQRRQTVVLIEADLIRARREADVTDGALQMLDEQMAELAKLPEPSASPDAR